MKWYFSCNQEALFKYSEHIVAAIASSYDVGDLSPNFIYDGEDNNFIMRLQEAGVIVHKLKTFFYNDILKVANNMGGKSFIRRASGAYLRFSIPLIEQDDDTILYTDTDVVFQRPIKYELEKDINFACAKALKGSPDLFNTGVMIMNVPRFRDLLEELSSFITTRNFAFQNFDQGALNEFVKINKIKYKELPDTMNWRAYWGTSEHAEIIHFHGPKIDEIRYRLGLLPATGDQQEFFHKKLFDKSPDGYRFYLSLLESKLNQAYLSLGL